MKNSNLIITTDWLRKNRACHNGLEWATGIIGGGMRLDKFIREFKRADWLIWTLEKAEVLDKIGLIRCAIACAEEVLPIYESKYPYNKLPRNAITAARKYCDEPTEEDRDMVRVTSAVAYVAYATVDTVAYAPSDVGAFMADAVTYMSSDVMVYMAYHAAADTVRAAADRNLENKRLCAKILKILTN